MPSQPARRRIFLVGCPRSGTTLLQSLLASHSEIASFPESHFFTHLLPGRAWARRAGLVARRAPAQFDAFITALGSPPQIRPRLPLARLYARAFVRLLDAAARNEGKCTWIEKSPEHLRYIDTIERRVPGAAFIHIVRSGADVAASLYAASNTPWKGFGRPMSLEQCVDRWTADVAITRRYLVKPNHFLIRYEDLVADPAWTLKRACAFVRLAFEAHMLENHRVAAERVILPWEHWKAGVLDTIRNANGTKLNEVLNADERYYVLSRTCSVEMPSDDDRAPANS